MSSRHLWAQIRDHARLRHPRGQGARHYNVLQKMAYSIVIFVVCPMIVVTGLAQSPGLTAVFPGGAVRGGKESGNVLPSWKTLDLSAGLAGEQWELQAYFENVLDEEYYTEQISWSFRPTVYYIPRIYGVRYTYRFRR